MFHAFDPGMSLGWAYWSSQRPQSKLIDLHADCEGAVYLRARSRLLEIINPNDIVGIEAALMPRSVSIRSRLVLFGIRSAIVAVAYERVARLIEIEPHRWRAHFIRCVTAPKQVPRKHRRAWLKAKAQEEVQRRGWGDVSQDEADAFGILDYLRSSVDAEYAIRTTPLFAECEGV